MTAAQVKEAKRLYGLGKTVGEIAATLHVPKSRLGNVFLTVGATWQHITHS